MEKTDKLYRLQREHMNSDLKNSRREEIHKSWFKEDTVDYWRHKRMYSTITPIANYYKDAKWLSIGDGRYGLDAYYLNKMFEINVFPTDISKNMLKKGQEMGLFDKYGVENAEALTFEDNSFDVIFCKESFHHFPRPIIAFYEMVRVAKEAIILIEPNDVIPINKKKYVKSALRILLYKLINKNITPYIPCMDDNFNHTFEQSGNYLYSLSNRELNKIVHGLDLAGIAYYGFNDSYLEGCEFEKATAENKVFKKIKQEIEKNNKLEITGLTTTITFKTKIALDLKKTMINFGYKFYKKFDNPFLSKNK